MQITYRRLVDLVNACAQWLVVEANAPTKHEKFAYAVRKVQKAGLAVHAKYIELREDVDIEHAEERDGVLRRDERGQLQHSKEGLKARNVALRALADQMVDVSAFRVKPELVPADLSPEWRDLFEGVLISPSPDLELVERPG